MLGSVLYTRGYRVKKKDGVCFYCVSMLEILMSQMSFSSVKGSSLNVKHMAFWLVAGNSAQMKLWKKQ